MTATDIVSFRTEGREVYFTTQDIRNLVNPDASQQDVALFMAFCQAHRLDPIGTKDAYLVGYNTQSGYKASIITSYHVFNRMASAHADYDGIESGVTVLTNQGQIIDQAGAVYYPQIGQTLLGGWAKVYSKERSHPFEARVMLSDYSTGRSQWKTRPAMMIEKVAKCQAWRGAYPDMHDLYDSAEMSRATTAPEEQAPIEVQPIQAQPQAQAAPQAAQAAPAPKQAPAGLSEERKAFMAKSAQRIADATGRDLTEIKRELMEVCGNPLTVPDEQWGEYQRGVLTIADGMCRNFEQAIEPDAIEQPQDIQF